MNEKTVNNFNEKEWFDDNCIIIKMGTNDVRMIGEKEFQEFLNYSNLKYRQLEQNILNQINTLELGIKSLEERRKFHSNQSIILDINNSIEQLENSIKMLNQILTTKEDEIIKNYIKTTNSK